jgi:hypothetical protein
MYMRLTPRVLRSYLRNVYVCQYCSAVVRFVALINVLASNKICEKLVDKYANSIRLNRIRSSDRSILLKT